MPSLGLTLLLGGELPKVGRKVVPVQVGPSPKEARP